MKAHLVHELLKLLKQNRLYFSRFFTHWYLKLNSFWDKDFQKWPQWWSQTRFVPFWLFFWHFFPTFWLLYRWYNPSSMGGCDRINTLTFCQRLCQLYNHRVRQILAHGLQECGRGYKNGYRTLSGSNTCAFYGQVSILYVYIRGAFFNYVDKILPIIDHLPWHTSRKISVYRWYFLCHLPTSSCQRS